MNKNKTLRIEEVLKEDQAYRIIVLLANLLKTSAIAPALGWLRSSHPKTVTLQYYMPKLVPGNKV